MLMVLRIITLVGLVKLLLITEKPLWCAGVYAVLTSVWGLAFGWHLMEILLVLPISLGLALLYFWLLCRFQDGVLFWVIMILGFAIGLV